MPSGSVIFLIEGTRRNESRHLGRKSQRLRVREDRESLAAFRAEISDFLSELVLYSGAQRDDATNGVGNSSGGNGSQGGAYNSLKYGEVIPTGSRYKGMPKVPRVAVEALYDNQKGGCGPTDAGKGGTVAESQSWQNAIGLSCERQRGGFIEVETEAGSVAKFVSHLNDQGRVVCEYRRDIDNQVIV